MAPRVQRGTAPTPRHFPVALDTEKSFRNLIKSTWNQSVFTIFRLIWNQTDVRLDPNQSENGIHNLISGWFNKISKRFLCVQSGYGSLGGLQAFFLRAPLFHIFCESCHKILRKFQNVVGLFFSFIFVSCNKYDDALWAEVECAHRFPACRMRRLKGFPVGSAFTVWDYAGILCNLYRDAGPKCCHHFQTSRAQSPLNPFYTWCNMFLTRLHHSPVVRCNPLLSPSPPYLHES